MKICIIGAGKIGSTLAERLLGEGHDITIIDRSDRAIANVSNSLDVIGYVGNGATYHCQRDAGVATADMLIAATATDEVNMLACLVAHKLGVRYTVPRVRDPEYFHQMNHLREELGLSMVINPELATAEEIARILRFPSANRVELFAKGRAELVECRMPMDSVLSGLTLIEAAPKIGAGVLVCAVVRGEQVIIPSGHTVIEGGDVLYLTGTHGDLVRAFKKIDMHAERLSNVMIMGGSRIAYYLASMLDKDDMRVVLIERDPDRAVQMAAQLPKARVIRGDAMNQDVLTEEGITRSDAFVALTGIDECNILSAAYAKRAKVRKIVAKVNNKNLYALSESMGLESIVSPRKTTADIILGYVRAITAGADNANVELMYSLAEDRVEALEFLAPTSGKYLNMPLSEMPIKPGILVCCIIRGRKIIIPRGSDTIQPMDRVIVVTASCRLSSLSDIVEKNA